MSEPDCGEECAQVLRRLETFLDGECQEDLNAFVAQHLDACHPCLDRADFERTLRAMIATKCRDRAPADLAARVAARLHLTVQ